MYVPRPFAVTDDETWDLLGQMAVGHLVTSTEQGLMATVMPWVLDRDSRRLIGHMARPNPQWQTPWSGQALLIFEGPNGYVSPSWYPSKAEHGRVVPTWDYVVIHVHGVLVVHDEPDWAMDAVQRLTDRHEQQRPEPWRVADAPVEYIDGQLRGIVGLELRVERVEASVKMSQNKSSADAAGVVSGFSAEGNEPVADWVRRAMS